MIGLYNKEKGFIAGFMNRETAINYGESLIIEGYITDYYIEVNV